LGTDARHEIGKEGVQLARARRERQAGGQLLRPGHARSEGASLRQHDLPL